MNYHHKNKRVLVFIFIVLTFRVYGQDTLRYSDSLKKMEADNINEKIGKLKYHHLITPAIFIGFGIVSLESHSLKQLNYSTKSEIRENSLKQISLDNYTQYAPAVMVYGLNAAGVKGKHNFKDRTIIYTTSQIITASFVVPLKHIVKEERPDGSNNLSFPSGHTATAFSSAQFMFREYKDTDFLLSISGYPFAIFTGVYRTINDRHWVSDVVTGAGLGILSTELAYWLYPHLNKLLGNTEKETKIFIAPFYQDGMFGVGVIKNF